MTIQIRESTMIRLGEGDVFMCTMETPSDGRHFVALINTAPGTIGGEVGRESDVPIHNGDALPDGCVVIESDNPESVQQLIEVLEEYRDELSSEESGVSK